MQKIASAIIQARTGSTRLPGKMIKKLGNERVIEWVIKRLKKSKKLHQIILATSTRHEDRKLIEIAKKNEISFFAGSAKNVLKRFYEAAKKFKIENIVRICADNPFISSSEVDLLIGTFINNNRKFSFNHRSFQKFMYADGFGAEIIAFEDLKTVYEKAFLNKHKEHVTLYLWENYKNYELIPAKTGIPKNKRYLRADIDTKKDLVMLNDFVNKFSINVESNLKDIINCFHSYQNP
jgi:spore coat polysaccharide biosynthesis protein SpsF|tara:strand:- start:2014 stop:2721 length:708 start_codon:yes stop_codon:yes gene_type:complete